MKKLIVLDYCIATVDIYDINDNINVDEEFIKSLGFNTNICEWMCGDNIEINYHDES